MGAALDQTYPERTASPVEANAQVVRAEIEFTRDLTDRRPIDDHAMQDTSIRRRERRQRALQAGTGAGRRLHGGFGWGGGRIVRPERTLAVLGTHPAVAVDRGVSDQPCEPRQRLVGTAWAGRGGEGLEVGLLDHVLFVPLRNEPGRQEGEETSTVLG